MSADLGLIRRFRHPCAFSPAFHPFLSFFTLFLAPVIRSFSATLAGLAFAGRITKWVFYYILAEERSK